MDTCLKVWAGMCREGLFFHSVFLKLKPPVSFSAVVLKWEWGREKKEWKRRRRQRNVPLSHFSLLLFSCSLCFLSALILPFFPSYRFFPCHVYFCRFLIIVCAHQLPLVQLLGFVSRTPASEVKDKGLKMKSQWHVWEATEHKSTKMGRREYRCHTGHFFKTCLSHIYTHAHVKLFIFYFYSHTTIYCSHSLVRGEYGTTCCVCGQQSGVYKSPLCDSESTLAVSGKVVIGSFFVV